MSPFSLTELCIILYSLFIIYLLYVLLNTESLSEIKKKTLKLKPFIYPDEPLIEKLLLSIVLFYNGWIFPIKTSERQVIVLYHAYW